MIKEERGFSLVELLVATAITGLIVSGLGTAIYQILTVTDYGNDRLTATHEVQNVAHWFSFDGQRASMASGGSELVLTLPDDSSVTYTVIGTKLDRMADGSTMTLAQNIASANFSIEDQTITMTITSYPQGRWSVSENGTYQVHRRPTEE
jgi:prepilin-type N-terminal cleavage/methylation domain-containing protein